MTDIYQIPSYAKSFSLGHRALVNFFAGDDEVWRAEEKVDGSQGSVTLRDGRLYFRSKGRAFTEENPDDMFKSLVRSAQERQSALTEGWIYRGEYLKSPKHNCLSYSRVPEGNLVVFDIEREDGSLLTNAEINAEANRVGFEPISLLMEITHGAPSLDLLTNLLKQTSQLGGPPIEGVVFKRTVSLQYDAQLGKLMIAKYVSEAFKEDQKKDWRESNPTRKDVVAALIDQFTSKMRLQKCIQALRDNGKLEGSLRDIGALMKSFPEDLLVDHRADIAEALFNHFWPDIKRGVTRPIPQMYKDWLVENPQGGDS